MRDHGNFFLVKRREGGRDDRARKKEPCIDNRSFAAFNVVCTVQHMHFYDPAAIVEITLSHKTTTWFNLSFPRSIISVVAFIEFFLQHDLDPYTGTIVSLNNNLAILSVGLCRFSSALFPLPFFRRRRRRFRPLLSHQSRTRRQRRKRIGSKKSSAGKCVRADALLFPLFDYFFVSSPFLPRPEEKPTNKMVRSCAFFL